MEIDLFEVFKSIYAAVTSGQWALVASLALVAVVFGVRKFVAPRVPFFASDLGGVLLVFLGSFGGAAATALGAGEPFSWALLGTAAKVAFGAMGGYAALKKALLPLASRIWAWFASKIGPKEAA